MMSIFKVNISKKIMACSSVQVRLNLSICKRFPQNVFRYGKMMVYPLRYVTSVLQSFTYRFNLKNSVKNLMLN